MQEKHTKLYAVPIDFAQANAFVALHHRHHKPRVGHKFSLACAIQEDDQFTTVGVAIVGRPIARMLDDKWTLEVNRIATDGTKNACSFLYASSWRVAREMGYRKLITYILDSEPGISLSASGWKCIGEAGGGSWERKHRTSVDKHPTQGKIKYEVSL